MKLGPLLLPVTRSACMRLDGDFLQIQNLAGRKFEQFGFSESICVGCYSDSERPSTFAAAMRERKRRYTV
jgi:hypothetical protein